MNLKAFFQKCREKEVVINFPFMLLQVAC